MSGMSTAQKKEKAVAAALELAVETGWPRVTMAGIAVRSAIPPHELYELFEDRTDILAAYGRMVDRTVLERAGEPDPALTTRERLFDLMMERFDVLNENRAAVLAILRSLRGDPKQAVIGLPHLGRSLCWMLEAAGASTAGPAGAAKIAALTALYLKTLKVWAADESPDMGTTMAALDRALGRAEEWAQRLSL